MTGNPAPDAPVVWAPGFVDRQEFAELMTAAFATAELDDAGGARASIAMYEYFPQRPGSSALAVRSADGQLVGFAYGYPNFQWADHTSDWDDTLRAALGGEDERLVGAWTVMCLALHPRYQGRGIGRDLLRRVVPAESDAWLCTRDAQTPAQRLYAAQGWTEIGRGALAGPGQTSVVMLKPAVSPIPATLM